MMEILARAIDYKDAECVEMFRLGGPLFGFLPYSGNGDQIEYAMEGSLKELMKNRGERNKSLVAGLKEDANSDVLLNKACEDAQMGRMTRPRPINEFDLEKVVLSPRFAVEQGNVSCRYLSILCQISVFISMSGLDDAGKPKFRAIDDFSRSQINACTAAAEKIRCDTLDMFHDTLREMHMRLKVRVLRF